MRRRFFIQSSSATIALALAGCGGGGGSSTSGAGADSAATLPSGVSNPSITSSPSVANSVVDAGTAAASTAPASTAPAQIPQSAAVVPGDVSYPFGARLDRYVAGVLPSANKAEMDAAVKASYDAWKARAVVDVPSVPGGKAVRFSGSDYLAVSEGMGYGMLITVLMAGYDPQARATFDALLTTVRARPALGMAQYFGDAAKNLMDWRLKKDGTSSDPVNLGANAMDGDLDIAMALLMAHRQWGSKGTWNYRQEGLNTINALKLVNMREDGTTKGLPSDKNNRTSDYMIGHFRAFQKATGDALWGRAVDRAYKLVDRMQTVYSPNAGLIPDFVINTDSENAEPSHGYIGDGTATEGFFTSNAQRDPWRFGTDYVLSGDERWKNVCNKMVGFIKRDSGGDPTRIGAGYYLDGTPMDRSYAPRGVIGPLMVGAMVDGQHQDFLNTLWAWNSSHFTTDYYDSELQLIPMIVASGNWWNP